MTRITVQIDDTRAEALRDKAARFGLNAEELLTASISDLVNRPDDDFDDAVRRVLSKNKELYQRLA